MSYLLRSLACVMFLLLVSVSAAGAQQGGTAKILVINSYNFGYDWSDQELLGFKKRILETFPHLDIYIETLDTKNFYAKNHFPQVRALLYHKYRNIKFSAIVVMDNAALTFARDYRRELFPQVPLLFCGINNYRPQMLDGQHPITGIAEQHDLGGTLQLALKLQPDTQDVIVVHDYTDTGVEMRRQLEAVMARFPQLHFRFIAEQPLEETISELGLLHEGSIVLLLSYTVEKTGRSFTQAATAQRLSLASHVPVYAVHHEQLGHGIIGGMMLSGVGQGELVAGQLARLLKGEKTDQIPVVVDGIARPAFDAKVLDHYGLSRALVPPDAEVIHLPRPFYLVSKKLFWLALGIFSLLFLLLLGMVRNSWKRKQLEHSLRLSEKRFRLLIEQAPEAILVYDVEDERMMEANAKASELFACPREQLLRDGIQHYFTSEQADGMSIEESRQFYFKRALAGEHVQFQRSICDAAGNRHICEVLLVHLPFQGQKWLRESFIDITEKMSLEEQLRQAEKMESIGKMAGGIAHDFNNQLASIMGYAEMLQRNLNSGKLQTYTQHIQTAARRSAGLIRQLLDFSRKGQQVSAVIEIDVLLDEVLAMLRHSIDKSVQIVAELNAGPVTVVGDPDQLQNALLNLAINARDAMPDGGHLTFRTDLAYLDGKSLWCYEDRLRTGTYLRISVCDTGCGMDQTTQKRIFEPFFTTKGTGKGTGMGLASVYGAVRSHQGHIHVHSAPGQGATFHLFLPLCDTMLPVSGEEKRLLPVSGNGNILLVDDEEQVRGMSCEMLRELGYRVTACADGHEAVSFYRNNWSSIDLALIDMTMPDMDGGRTYLELRRINPALRAILCSGYSMNGTIHSHLAAGFNAFVSKPFELHELSATVARVLQE